MLTLLQDNPIIASVKDEDGLTAALSSECHVVFVLYGDVLTIPDIIGRLKDSGRTTLVDVDLLDGFSSREIVIEYLRRRTPADGILSSKAFMVKAAREQGLLAVHRFFLIDSMSYHNLSRQARLSQADCIEILPGCIPRVITWIRAELPLPLIAGGLVCDRADVMAALQAGATAIASSNPEVWAM